MSQQPLQIVHGCAEDRPRFVDSARRSLDLPRHLYVHGRSRVLFLSPIGHPVIVHGSTVPNAHMCAPQTIRAKA